MRVTRLPILALPAALALGLAASTLTPASAVPPDDTVPTVTVEGVQWQKFFPADDGYRDNDRISYVVSDAFDPAVDVTVVLTDASANVLGQTVEEGATTGTTHVLAWDGTDFAGNALAGGDYTLTFTATDAEGNTSATDATTLTVDEGRLASRTARGWVTAKPSVTSKDVRRCSTLKSPVRGWNGSLGYYANTRCNRTGLPSVVWTVHGVYVPEAYKDAQRGWFYGSMQVKTWGGNSVKRRGSKAVLQYWNGSEWGQAKTMGSDLGAHGGRKVSAKPFIQMSDGRPAVFWSLYTANGHWYDVKKYGLTLKYKTMVYPSTAREAGFSMEVAEGRDSMGLQLR